MSDATPIRATPRHEIAGITACRHCGRKFSGPLHLVIGSAAGNGRLANLLGQMVRHLETEHPKQAAECDASAIHYLGMLRILNFTTQDPELRELTEKSRRDVHRNTRKVSIPDAKLIQQVDELAWKIASVARFSWAAGGVSPDPLREDAGVKAIQSRVQPMLLEVFRGMRDLYEEPEPEIAPPAPEKAETPAS
jgi:hypothetical protein